MTDISNCCKAPVNEGGFNYICSTCNTACDVGNGAQAASITVINYNYGETLPYFIKLMEAMYERLYK
jgi:hypothetical protein